MYSVKVDENYFYQEVYAEIDKIENGIDMPVLPPEENARCYYADVTTQTWIFSQEKYDELEAERIAEEAAIAEEEAEEQFIQELPAHVKQQRADIDYIMIVMDLDPSAAALTDLDGRSTNFNKIKQYYDNSLWDKARLHNVVGKASGITEAEYEAIAGDQY